MTLQQRFTFMESQAAHIESRVRMIQHASIQYPDLVGISREASPHADSIVYYSFDATGEMTDLANRANDLPLVSIMEQQHTVPIQWKGLAYDWTDRELGRAMMTGQSLSDRKVRAAFRVAEETKEKIFLNGDSGYGWDGMLNNQNIPKQEITSKFSASNDADVFDAVNTLIGGAWEDTNQVRICDTLLLPVDAFVALSRPMGEDANQSVMEYIRKYNPYTAATGQPLMIRTLRQLKTAVPAANPGDAGTSRAIAYPRDMDVLRYHVPQELTFIEPQRVGFSWIYHGTLVLGGLEIMEPAAMRYLDGV